MAKYGNILTVYNTDNIGHTQVEKALINTQTAFIKLNDTYYIETYSKKNTGDVIKELNAVGVEFIFFHNHIADSSVIKSNKVDNNIIQSINRILFK